MTTAEGASLAPPAPQRLEDTGLPGDLVLQIVAKTLHAAGELTGTQLGERLGVRFEILEPALNMLKREQQCEISGGALVGGPAFKYRLTDAGRVRAALFLRENHYIGALPVPLHQYQEYIREVRRRTPPVVRRDMLERAFSSLVLNRRVVDQLGPAIAAQHSLFVYGPSGNGKTVISQAIRGVLPGAVAVPHAISVDGHIIRVYNPVNHQDIDPPQSHDSLEHPSTYDRRWVLCERPLVTAGGELTLDALELGYSPVQGFYRAPLQVLANGGVLVLDDFGRQQISPRDLLSRWIVPLESRVDYLTLQTGQKFEIPFQAFVVFATNLKPSDLVDEAFLRRVGYKVLAESPTVEEFVQIFENYCRFRELPFDRSVVDFLLTNELQPRGVRLRGCQPRDLIEHALAIAGYYDHPRELTRQLMTDACASYFVEDRDLATA